MAASKLSFHEDDGSRSRQSAEQGFIFAAAVSFIAALARNTFKLDFERWPAIVAFQNRESFVGLCAHSGSLSFGVLTPCRCRRGPTEADPESMLMLQISVEPRSA